MTIFLLYTTIAIFLGTGIIYFASERPGYSHIQQTISELGEDHAPAGKTVNRGLFLPAGLALILLGLLDNSNANTKGLALCLGAGYLISALFPCDPGSPLYGSAKQAVHNAAGIVEYGGGIYFLNKARHLLYVPNFIQPIWVIAFLVICVLLTLFPGFRLRGLFQRIQELILFAQLLWMSYP